MTGIQYINAASIGGIPIEYIFLNTKLKIGAAARGKWSKYIP